MPTRTRVNWFWVLTALVVGGGLIGGAFYVETTWGWTGVAPEVLVNVGTAIGLASFLYFLQRRFTSTVIERVEQGEQRTELREQEFEQRVETELTDLQKRIDDRVSRQAVQQDAAIAAVSDSPTFDVVARAIGKANELEAITTAGLTVEASRTNLNAGLSFQCGWDFQEHDEASGQLRIELTYRPADFSDRIYDQRLLWTRDESAEQVGERLVTELQRSGLAGDAQKLDFQYALTNLQGDLQRAVAARRGDVSAWKFGKARPYEFVSGSWALTEAGIIQYPADVLMKQEEFPAHESRFLTRFSDRPAWEPPTCPPSVTEPIWERLIQRGRRLFPLNPGRFIYETVWRSYKGEDY